jgi:hypothetical protein
MSLRARMRVAAGRQDPVSSAKTFVFPNVCVSVYCFLGCLTAQKRIKRK